MLTCKSVTDPHYHRSRHDVERQEWRVIILKTGYDTIYDSFQETAVSELALQLIAENKKPPFSFSLSW